MFYRNLHVLFYLKMFVLVLHNNILYGWAWAICPRRRVWVGVGHMPQAWGIGGRGPFASGVGYWWAWAICLRCGVWVGVGHLPQAWGMGGRELFAPGLGYGGSGSFSSGVV